MTNGADIRAACLSNAGAERDTLRKIKNIKGVANSESSQCRGFVTSGKFWATQKEVEEEME